MTTTITVHDHFGNSIEVEIDYANVRHDLFDDTILTNFNYNGQVFVTTSKAALMPKDHKWKVTDKELKFPERTKGPSINIEADWKTPAERGIRGLSLMCHIKSRDAGWWKLKDGTNVSDLAPEIRINICGTKIALIHSEISEALEGLRKNSQDEHLPHRKTIEVELADAIIRIADLAGFLGLDLGSAIIEKLEYNANRADHKPEARNTEGGKVI